MTPVSVPQLAASVLSRSPWARRSAPWSLAEVRLNEAEYGEVHDCFRKLTPDAWQRAVAGLAPAVTVAEQAVTGQSLYGFYLLLLISDAARRNAWEGSLWAQVRQTLSTNAAMNHLLFDAGGQPSAATKMMIERAARRFGLRHAFDLPLEEGPGHQWYTTIFLQFGFSVRGFAKNAPLWGRNINLPKSVRLLLGHESQPASLGPMTSTSFGELWQTIRLAARKVLSKPDARRRLEASPWMPLGASDALLDAIERTDWSDIQGMAEPSAFADEMPSDTFIGRYWWSCRGGIPQVLAELSGLAALDLSQPFYDVVIDGKRVGRLLTADGCLQLIGPSQHVVSAQGFVIRVPGPLRPVVKASLLDPGGAARAEQSLALWTTDSPVSAIVPGDQSSRVVEDASGLPAGGIVVFIADQACRAEPQCECLPLDDGRSVAHVMPAEAARSARVLLADTVVWSPEGAIKSPGTAVLRVQVMPSPRGFFRDGDAVELVLAAADGLSPTALWCDGREQRPVREAPGTATFRVTYAMGGTPGELECLAVLKGRPGQIVVRRIREQIPVSGFFRVRKGQIQQADPERAITRGSLLRGGYFYMPPPTEDGSVVDRREWFAFEGRRPLSRFPAQAQPRYPVVGLGASLSVQRGPLNALRETLLALEVVDFGELRPAHSFQPDADGAISVQVQDTLLDRLDEYRCVVWDATGTVTSGVIAEQNSGEDGFIRTRLLPSIACESPVAVALCYRGIRVGAGWTKAWFTKLREMAARHGPLRAAAVLRWLHLPVLSTSALAAIRRDLLEPHPAEVIRGWSEPLELPTDDGELSLALPDAGVVQAGLVDSAWFGALREAAGEWSPTAEATERLIDGLAADMQAHELQPTPLIATTLRLVRVHPAFAVRVFRNYVAASLRSSAVRQLEEELARCIAGVPTNREVGLALDELAEQCARSLSALLTQPIDRVFVREAARPNSRDRDERFERSTGGIPVSAPELLCQIDSGRRLLALTALGHS